MNKAWVSLAAVCALVCGIYAYVAQSGFLYSTSLNAADEYYNLLARGFRAGQLSLKREVPPGFAGLPDPYDRTANARYGLLDLSYYRGKLYLYFGVTPAILLFWPYASLTGHYLSQKDAGVIFSMVGFLASVGLLGAVWRRYFAEVSVAVVAAAALALGLATFIPLLLARCDVHEVALSCGYALTIAALAALWRALHEAKRRGLWLAIASLAYGLAVGARPSLLFGAVILLAPVIQGLRERRKSWVLPLAAIGPIVLVGLGLMLYNALRFNNPFEFGQHYQLSGQRQVTMRFFGLHYLWFNFRVFFLEPAKWNHQFPFVHDSVVPPIPAGHGLVEHPVGVLTGIPLVWFALAVPLAWRDRSPDARSTLRGFLAAVAALFGIVTLTLSLYFGACTRYEVEFLSPLMLLAAIGILILERSLASGSGQAWRPVWRCAVRWGWNLLLVFSLAFSLLASVEFYSEARGNLGAALVRSGRIRQGIAQYERALQLNPDYAEAHDNLGLALMKLDRVPEAIRHFEQALSIRPDSAEAHDNLGVALVRSGRLQEGIEEYTRALQLDPNFAEAHNNLGLVLARLNRLAEAIGHFEQALAIEPDLIEARNNLGNALLQEGRTEEAVAQYEQALRIDPDSASTESNLGLALTRLGKFPEAITHYERALRIDPHQADAHYNLANALRQTGDIPNAIQQYQDALRIEPGDADSHNKLGEVFMAIGKRREAIEQLQQAFQINPNLAEAQSNLATLLVTPAGQKQPTADHAN
ncbi:MAG TPA: tetratricopeptide repeat protein [Verrucomicrobiae bacterium]|nr:tetratricopeptide repeat protein [Verrucomicrobiae bacterium]